MQWPNKGDRHSMWFIRNSGLFTMTLVYCVQILQHMKSHQTHDSRFFTERSRYIYKHHKRNGSTNTVIRLWLIHLSVPSQSSWQNWPLCMWNSNLVYCSNWLESGKWLLLPKWVPKLMKRRLSLCQERWYAMTQLIDHHSIWIIANSGLFTKSTPKSDSNVSLVGAQCSRRKRPQTVAPHEHWVT